MMSQGGDEKGVISKGRDNWVGASKEDEGV